PFEELDVVLAVPEGDGAFRREALVLGYPGEAGSLRHLRTRELEELGERLRDVQPAVEASLHTPLELVELLGIADRHELRWRLGQPVEERADRVHRDVLEAGVAVGLRRLLGDVELVVHVTIESEAFVLDRLDRLAR